MGCVVDGGSSGNLKSRRGNWRDGAVIDSECPDDCFEGVCQHRDIIGEGVAEHLGFMEASIGMVGFLTEAEGFLFIEIGEPAVGSCGGREGGDAEPSSIAGVFECKAFVELFNTKLRTHSRTSRFQRKKYESE